MKKTILSLAVLSLFSFTNIFGDESSLPQEPKQEKTPVEKSFFYADLGVGPLPLLVPTFGLGYRYQSNHLGADVALDVSSVYYVTTVKITPSFLYYFTPNLKSQFYSGIGANLGCLFNTHKHEMNKDATGFVAPTLIFGTQYQNEGGMTRFFEAGISIPTLAFEKFDSKFFSKENVLYYPTTYLKYGVAF